MVKAKYGVNICGNYTHYLKTHLQVFSQTSSKKCHNVKIIILKKPKHQKNYFTKYAKECIFK